ncbi:acyl carrier protein [Kwoniella shivajii]|uniref:Acyl carrier protein n=1 Tax=Kwoniella shivajii TaxID=564305 RepID=A0ABZ1D267_9TREE|nr:acyl carrier protein [Kwoniella shivajii]
MYRSIPVLRSALPSLRLKATSSIAKTLKPQAVTFQYRSYAAAAGLSKDDISSRVLDVLKSFEKVDSTKLSPSASFTSDLGLDSLDAVEVVMAIEEEFAIEIPDAEADEITTVQKAIDYVSHHINQQSDQ